MRLQAGALTYSHIASWLYMQAWAADQIPENFMPHFLPPFDLRSRQPVLYDYIYFPTTCARTQEGNASFV